MDAAETNLYRAIETVRNRQQDIKGAILISDGIFTQGRNPIFEAGNLSVPVMTVVLGDTVQQKDLIVEEVISNATGYVRTIHPVEANVQTNGFAGEQIEVQLRKGREVLQSQYIQAGESRTSHSLNFELELREEGLQQYEIVIPLSDKEWTEANNRQPFSIDVLNDKQRILSLAFEIHPDVSFVRSQLLSDENTQLVYRGRSHFFCRYSGTACYARLSRQRIIIQSAGNNSISTVFGSGGNNYHPFGRSECDGLRL
jgi:hypothetical protein